MENTVIPSKKYGFLTKRIKYIPSKYKALKFTAIFALIGFIIGTLLVALIPQVLIDQFGFMRLCYRGLFTLQPCTPFPYVLTTTLGLLIGALIGLTIDLIRKLSRN